MAFITTSYCTGIYGQTGYLNITVLVGPNQPVNLTYTSVTPILSNSVCLSCTSTLLYITGVVEYFQQFTVNLTGTSNGVIYATSQVVVSYQCSSILGCRICVNDTVNN